MDNGLMDLKDSHFEVDDKIVLTLCYHLNTGTVHLPAKFDDNIFLYCHEFSMSNHIQTDRRKTLDFKTYLHRNFLLILTS